MSRGRFITFEGGEGAGKTTLMAAVAAYLKEANKEMVTTREPGGTKEAEAIRNLLVTGDKDRWDAISETALFLVARRQHVQHVIEPALQAGKIVLCDRFLDSTLVYQGMAKGLGVQTVMAMSKQIVGECLPDRTFLLDIDPAIGLKRAEERMGGETGKETRFEAHGLTFHQQIREGFLELAKANPERITVVDANGSAETVLEKVKECLG